MSRRVDRAPHVAPVMTSRGVGVGASGIVITLLGIGLSSPILVWVGIAMVMTAVTAAAGLLAAVTMFRRRFPAALRDISPLPLSAGGRGHVTVAIRTARHRQGLGLSNALASQLDIREQAAAELTGGFTTKATVTRSPEELRLDYPLAPTQRGRWALGPALVTISEPLGMVTAEVAAGTAENVPVWPRVFDLSAATGALMGQADRVIMGARTPSTDDASLRDYRDGDDLRRVHWKSTARRGTMVVRADERAGVRPATVLLDLPVDPVAAEWAISAAASVGVSVLKAGHPVRLIGAGIPANDAHTDAHDSRDSTRAHLLNVALDLDLPLARTAALENTRTAIRTITTSSSLGDVVVAIVDPLADDMLASLVPLGDTGRAWAIVRVGAGARHDELAELTARALRRAGWKVTTASVRDDLTALWSELVAGGGA